MRGKRHHHGGHICGLLCWGLRYFSYYSYSRKPTGGSFLFGPERRSTDGRTDGLTDELIWGGLFIMVRWLADTSMLALVATTAFFSPGIAFVAVAPSPSSSSASHAAATTTTTKTSTSHSAAEQRRLSRTTSRTPKRRLPTSS